MKDYFLFITCVFILLSLADFLTPKGSSGKVSRGVISAICVLAVLSPAVKLINFDFSTISSSLNSEYYNIYLENYKNQTLKDEIFIVLENENINVESVEVKSSESLMKIVIRNDGQHINNTENAVKILIEKLYLENWEVICEESA